MPDPVTTGFLTLAAAHVLKESFTAIVKPTAEYLGAELRQYTETQAQRLRQISISGQRKLGGRLEQDGAVNPRVFRKVIDEGYLWADSLSADYYGGFLASSHSRDGKDDTNIPFVSMINRMSSDQLHGHWILYAILLNYMAGRPHPNLYTFEGRKEAALYLPWSTFMFLFEALRIDDIERPTPKFEFKGTDRYHYVIVNQRFNDKITKLEPRRLDVVFWGLLTSDLVEHIYWGMDGWSLAHNMRKDYPSDPLGVGQKQVDPEEIIKIIQSGGTWSDGTSVDTGGVVFEPSILGMDLFLRAQGLPPVELISLGNLNYDFLPEQFRRELMQNVRLVEPLPGKA